MIIYEPIAVQAFLLPPPRPNHPVQQSGVGRVAAITNKMVIKTPCCWDGKLNDDQSHLGLGAFINRLIGCLEINRVSAQGRLDVWI